MYLIVFGEHILVWIQLKQIYLHGYFMTDVDGNRAAKPHDRLWSVSPSWWSTCCIGGVQSNNIGGNQKKGIVWNSNIAIMILEKAVLPVLFD